VALVLLASKALRALFTRVLRISEAGMRENNVEIWAGWGHRYHQLFAAVGQFTGLALVV
jgi:hypothetical protein